jgi:hypothetical protein
VTGAPFGKENDMTKKSLVGIFALTLVMASSCLSLRDASAAAVGPSAYLSFADSPFNGGSFTYFHLGNV